MTDWSCIVRDIETEWERNRLRRANYRLLEAAAESWGRNAWLRERNRILSERVKVLTGCAETAERLLERERETV